MKRQILSVFAALMLILSACSSGSSDASTPSASANTTPSPSGETAQETAASDTLLGNFTSTDLDGNAVDSSVFSGKKVTMINVWATFCGPCLSEMPGLGELSQEYADQGFQIIGIPIDTADYSGSVDAAMVDTAKQLVSKTGADYLHILPSKSLVSAFLSSIYAEPTTFFVDENGKQLGQSYLGARSEDEWKEIVDSLLGQAS